ncbi:MAG TPA: tRNA 2-thiouridine(34) synthase MnmA [Solirubrobacteraceae bacterium]|nr:tRNA 2-thiouridine(34) synthase MnmA [Solirubrobacteraceae bacterium]
MNVSTGLVEHLERPLARGHAPTDAHTGAAGGAACGDLIRVSVSLDPADPEGRIADAGFDASGCGATVAAGSAVVALLREAPLLQAARIGPDTIAAELGGLIPAKRHAAELAADALHRALGAAARAQASLAPVANRTLVAMSGGVDSAVAALLVAQAGDDAVAVTLELWSDPENDGSLSCCSAQAVRSARTLAHDLGLPHFSVDLRAEFRAGVVEPWLAAHAAGLTPNPCVRCNGSVRLDAMLDLATRLGARTLATGHYARIHHDRGNDAHDDATEDLGPRPDGRRGGGGGALLRVAADSAKDQSYALAALLPTSLARLRFPLGGLTKPEVRTLARHAGLPVARRPDSQDLCFLAGTRQTDFLARHGRLSPRPGSIVDRDGRRLGGHRGIQTVTVGQRRGLGIGGREPLYVLATDLDSDTVTVGSRAELLTRTVPIRDVVLRRDARCVDAVKLRYRGSRLACRMPEDLAPGTHRSARVELVEPTERTAPGQIACLYSGELIVGHGTIASPTAL